MRFIVIILHGEQMVMVVLLLQDGYWQKLYTMDRLGKVSSVDACVAGGKLYLAAANNNNARQQCFYMMDSNGMKIYRRIFRAGML